MFSTLRTPSSRSLTRGYASIQAPPAAGGAIQIDPLTYAQKTVKPPTSKKSMTHADYVHYYRSNPTMLILQHNNLTQAQLLKIRAELKVAGAKLRIIRVGIFEHAVRVATLQESLASSSSSSAVAGVADTEGEKFLSMDVNAKELSVAAKNKRHTSGLDVTQLLSGPICTVTFPDPVSVSVDIATALGADTGSSSGTRSEVAPDKLRQVMRTVQGTGDKLILLGGRFEGQVFAIDALDAVSKLPGLQTLRGQLLSVLGSPAVRLSQLLGSPAQTLGRTMEGRRVALEEGGDGGEQKSAPSSS